MDPSIVQSVYKRIVDSVSTIIVGKEEVIGKVTCAFLCSGHVLLEDVPGTGKTMLLRAFAKSIGGDFKRIQFTPDLLPSDLTGINYYNQKEGEFLFRPGPLFANIVLADEINRATPRTQSSLLEAMAERQISVDGKTMALTEPFMVMASQNPLESYGTFPLPEAQIDRFFMCLTVGYMTRDQEMSVMVQPDRETMLEDVRPVVSPDEIILAKKEAAKVTMSPEVRNYLMDIIEKTRSSSLTANGASTRGTLALYKAAQVTAAVRGRDFAVPEDVRDNAVPVLAHRLMLTSSGSYAEKQRTMMQLLSQVEVPMETGISQGSTQAEQGR